MIIIWRADFDGTRTQLEEADTRIKELGKEHGYSVDGPYYPQDAALLYVFHGTLEQMNKSGRELLPWLEEEGIPLTPMSYELAVSPDEFWGPA